MTETVDDPAQDLWNHVAWLEAALAAAQTRIEELLSVPKLYKAYDAVPRDRGGKEGPKGRAWQAFLDAVEAALSTPLE